jgi:hypothetical protein
MSVMRIAKRFLPLLILLAFSLAATSCRPLLKEVFQPPKIRVADVLLESNPFDDPKGPLDFTLTLEVNNPNGYPLDVANVAYSAVIGRETVAEGEHRSDIRIEASQVTTVRVPLKLRTDAFRNAMRKVLQARRVDYEVIGSVAVNAPVVGVVHIPFSRTGSFDPLDLLKRKGFGFK